MAGAAASGSSMRSDDVGRVIDKAKRLIQHRHRVGCMSGRELGLDVDKKLPQPDFVGFGLFELADEAIDFSLSVVRLRNR